MEKLQGLIKVINNMGLCEMQCSFEKCPNTTVWNKDGNIQESTSPDGIVSECVLCDKLFCWDHTDPMADVTICQNCPGEYWYGRYTELQKNLETQKTLLEEICDMTNTSINHCYDRTCNKIYINSGKANQAYVVNGTNDVFHLCDYCEQGYCDDCYKLLIPSVDDPTMKRCRICNKPVDEVESDEEV